MQDFEQVARGLGEASSGDARLEVAVQAALQLVEGCDHAGILVVDTDRKRRRLSLRAATDEAIERAAQWQLELGEGPALDAVRDDQTVICMDLTTERRWPRWGPKVHEQLGLCSMVSLLLHTDGRAFGALTLYGDRGHAFDAADLATAKALAGHLAVAMAAGREIDHLRIAVVARTVIGQAEGILMERLGIDAEQAFAYLRRVASQQERKLAQVAADIVRTRRLPAADTEDRAGAERRERGGPSM